MERLQETAPRPERVIHHTAETRQEHTHTEVRQTLVEQHRIIERPAPVPAAARPRLDHTIIEQRAATPAKSPAQGAPENIPARPPAAAKPSPTLPQRVEKMETARQPAPGIEPAPVITVSIGRVEIRTAQPTASAPRTPRAAAPKLGLDEYLRRRSGGVQ